MRDKSNKQMIEDGTERLKEWLSEQPHLPQDIDPGTLKAFVIGTKSLDIAKSKLDAYFTLRGKEPKLFHFSARDASSDSFREASKAGKMFFLPKPTPEGYRVFFHTVNDEAQRSFVHSQDAARILMMLEYAMREWPHTEGFVFVYDLEGASASILHKCSPKACSVGFNYFQSSLPVKFKGAIVFNSPYFIRATMNWLIKPFLKRKLYDRITATSEDARFLEKHFPKEMLPSDYGGDEKSSQELEEYWYSVLTEERSWYLKTSKMVSDEAKRPPDTKETHGVLNFIQGAFKKLKPF